jgi:hypothetical protein
VAAASRVRHRSQREHGGWLHDRLIAWDYSEHTSAYSPGSDSWESLRGPPVDACEDVPAKVTAKGLMIGQLCGELVMMRPGEDRWHSVTRDDLPVLACVVRSRRGPRVRARPRKLRPGRATKMFVFRPPASFACGGFPGLDGGELAAAVAARTTRPGQAPSSTSTPTPSWPGSSCWPCRRCAAPSTMRRPKGP